MQLTRRRQPPEPRLELTPLLDVMFLLLTFFIFAFVLMVRLDVTGITLPTASAGQSQQRTVALTLTIDAQGALAINGRATSLEALEPDLKIQFESRPEARLLIATDGDTRTEDLFNLVDALKAAGFTELKFLRRPQAVTPGSP